MRLQPRELAVWSFVMASAHGAGLMLLPVVHADGSDHSITGLAATATVDAGGQVVLAAGIHTIAMVAAMTGVALLVYHQLGLAILRRAWLNTDLLWWPALIAAGVLVLFT